MIINSIRTTPSAINKNATFQNNAFTITLPTEPIVTINTKNKELNVQSNIIIQEEPKEIKLDIVFLLNTIDVDKLIDQKKSKYIDIYELAELKKFANLIDLNYNNVKKKQLIENIKLRIKDQFNGPNLIADLKALDSKLLAKKLYKHIEILMNKHEIVENKKQTILSKIKDQLKLQVDPIKYVIHLLESEWIKK